jgi:hypothetical protein
MLNQKNQTVMKKFFYVLAVAVIFTSCLGYKTVTFTDDEFVKTHENLDGTQDELFLKANEWMVSVFNSAKSVVQHSDKQEGVIIGKYLMHTIPTSNTGMYGTYDDIDVFAVIDIRVRDGKARLQIKPTDYSHPNMLPYTKQDALDEMNRLAVSFENKIRTGKVDF